MPNCPDICCDSGKVAVRQGDSAKRRHRAWMLLWLWHSASDDIGDAPKAAIPPKPFPARKLGSYRRANAISAMTSRARRSGNLPMEDLFAERDLFARCSWGHR